nr:MAG: hypothetical protein [Microvirus sp.]
MDKREVVIQNPYNRIRQEDEINSGEILVETAGYINKKARIESMIRAGERLEAIRKGYDTNDPELDDIAIDPTRSGDFDLSDVGNAFDKADNAIRRVKEASKAKTGSGEKNDSIPDEKVTEVKKDAQEGS